MTIQISWDNDAHTILRYQFEAEWHWEDLYKAIGEGLKLADGRHTAIDTIFDASADVRLPPGNMLFHSRRLLDVLPPQRGFVVILSNQPLLRNVVGIINQVYKTNFAIAHNLNEARALIADFRADRGADAADGPAQAPSPSR
jgi:hypothetical protein